MAAHLASIGWDSHLHRTFNWIDPDHQQRHFVLGQVGNMPNNRLSGELQAERARLIVSIAANITWTHLVELLFAAAVIELWNIGVALILAQFTMTELRRLREASVHRMESVLFTPSAHAEYRIKGVGGISDGCDVSMHNIGCDR